MAHTHNSWNLSFSVEKWHKCEFDVGRNDIKRGITVRPFSFDGYPCNASNKKISKYLTDNWLFDW